MRFALFTLCAFCTLRFAGTGARARILSGRRRPLRIRRSSRPQTGTGPAHPESRQAACAGGQLPFVPPGRAMPRESGSERRAARGPRGSYTEPRAAIGPRGSYTGPRAAIAGLCAFHALRFSRFALFTLCAFCAFCAFLFVDSRGRSVPSVLCVLLLCVLFICHYPIPSEPTIRHSIILRREKTHQLPLAIPYRHLQTLLERAVASCLLRGCGVLTRAACRVRNDSGGIRAEKRGSRERFGSRKAR